MAGILYLGGAGANLWSRYTVTPSSEDSLFPKANLYDDWPAAPFRFNVLAANSEWKVDLDAFVGTGEMTTFSGGAPVGWTKTVVTGGTVTQSAGKARLNGGASGTASIAKAVTVRAGEWLHFEADLAAAASVLGRIEIYNTHTKKYLTSAGAWTTTQTNVHTINGIDGHVYSINFQVEAYGGSNPVQPSITVSFFTSSNGNFDVDNVYLYAGVNFCSVHGHNLDSVTPRLEKSTDNFIANGIVEATMTIAQPSFYSKLSAMTYSRYWRVQLVGTNQAIPYIGESVLGQITEAARGQNFGWETSYLRRQIRNQAIGGGTRVYNLATAEERVLRLTWGVGDAAFAELRDEWFRRSEGGRYPMVVVPYDAEAHVIHGRLLDTMSAHRTFLAWHEASLEIQESAHPSVTS